MNVYNKFYKAIEIRINPTFDKIEGIIDYYPKLATPIILGLVLAFPAWCALGQFVNIRK